MKNRVIVTAAAVLLCACAPSPPVLQTAAASPAAAAHAGPAIRSAGQALPQGISRAVAGLRHESRRSPVRQPARRRERRRLAGARGVRRDLSIGARAHRPREAVARQPGRCAAAASRARVRALAHTDARGLALESARVHAASRASSLYNLLAREFAPLPERLQNAGARLDEFPRFLAQVREVLDPARVPKIHAETAVKQNAGLLSMLDAARGKLVLVAAVRRPGKAEGVAREGAQRDQPAPDLARKAPAAGGQGRLPSRRRALRPEARVRVVLAALAPGNPRAGRGRARGRARCDVRDRAAGAQGKA